MSQLVVLSNGEKLAPNVYRAFLELQAAVRAALNVTLWVSSGFRTAEEQERIFRARYRQQSSGNGPYGDVRWWNGVRWVRHSPDGTVAVPGTSLHEKASAVDFGGIPAGGGTTLANWLRANAHRYGFSPTGYGFGEAWHYDFTGDPWAAPAGQERPQETPKPTTPTTNNLTEALMSATPFIVNVSKIANGKVIGTKSFFVQPNPLAASNPKAKPFIGFVVQGGNYRDLPVHDATTDWAYNSIKNHIQQINQA